MHLEIVHSASFIAPRVIALSFLLVAAKALSNRITPLWKPLPPGPSFISRWRARGAKQNLLMTWLHWSQNYGEIMSLMNAVYLGPPTIVLSSPKVVTDLLDKRGDIYSSRPRNIIASEICYRNLKGTLQPMGPHFKKFRTLMNATMNVNTSKGIRPLGNVESRLLLRDLLMSGPENIKGHVLRSIHSIAFYTAFGLRINQLSPSHIKFYEELEKFLIENVFPGNYLVDHFPVLLRLPRPLQWFRKNAEKQGNREELFFRYCLTQTKALLEKGHSSGSSAARALGKQESYKWSDLETALTASSPYAAGVLTTYLSFETFVSAMLLYPETLKKAQSEIDSVVGSNRLPDFEDFDSLPYIRAMIKEIGRWRPPTPLGLPHAVTRDDVYEGMLIPAGSTVIANIYAITRNAELFPDPEEFKPERFLDNTNPFFKNNVIFGFGRRICPGQHIATDEIFIMITRLLWAFDIVPKGDTSDESNPLKHPGTSAKVAQLRASPPPYKLVPRRESVHSIVIEEGLLAEKEVQAWESFTYRESPGYL